MKVLKLPALFVFALLFGCKSSQPTGPTTSSPASVSEVAQMLDTTSSIFLQFADSTDGDPWAAIMRTASWLQTQPNVQDVETLDSAYIRITLKSGLQGVFYFDPMDASGQSLLRGGGPRETLNSRLESFRTLSANTITNKKVLIFSPPYSEFYGSNNEMQKVLDVLSSSPLGLDVTLLKNEQASFNIVSTFHNYGLVILDTHGMPDAFMVGGVETLSDTDATALGSLSQDQLRTLVENGAGIGTWEDVHNGNLVMTEETKLNPADSRWFRTGHHYRYLEFLLNAKYLLTIPHLTNTVVFGNMCFSGWNTMGGSYNVLNPIRASFLSLDPVCYFGYAFVPPYQDRAQSVSDAFAHQMEDSLLTQLISNLDSTGHCYLQADGTQYYDYAYANEYPNNPKQELYHYGADDYAYMLCGDTLLDTRDGQKYPTVCIGSQTWMAKNLNYDAAGSKCYDSLAMNCDTFGRLYPWTVAMNGSAPSDASPSGVQGICPKGWHIPSSAEWKTLFTTLGGMGSAGAAMKTTDALWDPPNIGATNSSRFSALPGGNFVWDWDINIGLYRAYWGKGMLGLFLSSSYDAADTTPVLYSVQSGTGAVVALRTTNSIDPNQPAGNASCRCVKDP